MYIKKRYGFFMTFNWSKWPFIYGTVYSAVISLIFFLLDYNISLPWQPISLLGIAVAFYLGFKNNSSYDRTWEARKIWGSIVNNSRSFAAAIVSFVQGETQIAGEEQKKLIYRHIAWLTSLRYQLRLSKEWEHVEDRINGIYIPIICEDYYEKLDDEIIDFIPDEEFQSYKQNQNMATQLLATQSKHLQRLRDEGFYDDFRHMELQKFITSFYEDQGKSERIKNFPFPRQYASAGLWITLLFCILLPFGLLSMFNSDSILFWLTIPFGGLITWVFYLMEKIGDYSENPFEGTYNDVPITSIAKGIEIDIREMIGDTNLPTPVPAQNGFLM